MEKDINEPIKSMLDRAYNKAIEDVWNKWLECDLDFETFNAWLCEKMQRN